MRTARAYLYGAHPQPLGSPSQAIIDLLQNDPLSAKDTENPLGYTQTPTNGDPLQYVNWFVFGTSRPQARRSAASRTPTRLGRRRSTRSPTPPDRAPTASGCGISRLRRCLHGGEVPRRR